jgi:hypothetical protein
VKKALRHLIEAVESAELHTTPYPYLNIDNVFPEDFYKELVSKIPDKTDSRYKKLSSYYSDRYVMDLFKGENGNFDKRQFSGFWKEFQDTFISNRDLVNVLAAKYKDYILHDFNDSNTFVNARITKDIKGYSIGPHRDRKNKIISVVFYLPKEYDEAKAMDFGTEVCTPKDPNMKHTDNHYSFDKFDVYKTAEYKPNSLFSWAIIEDSYHGVSPTTLDGDRVTMGYFLKAHKGLAGKRGVYKQ